MGEKFNCTSSGIVIDEVMFDGQGVLIVVDDDNGISKLLDEVNVPFSAIGDIEETYEQNGSFVDIGAGKRQGRIVIC